MLWEIIWKWQFYRGFDSNVLHCTWLYTVFSGHNEWCGNLSSPFQKTSSLWQIFWENILDKAPLLSCCVFTSIFFHTTRSENCFKDKLQATVETYHSVIKLNLSIQKLQSVLENYFSPHELALKREHL